MSKPVAVVAFPGSNCEHDVVSALESLGQSAEIVWHRSSDLSPFGGVVLPGGFAHGDYLRPGAIARFSPVMSEVVRLAGQGRPVLGICNGFQVLTEAGLLPGALQKNAGLSFLCETVALRVTSTSSMLTHSLEREQELHIPINHFEGNYVCDSRDLAALRAEDRIVLRYVDNPNGSIDDIAGISSPRGNVVGLMPHPERAMDLLTGERDGVALLQGFVSSLG
jgi:phosphoribosylformylglycinamidine synthase